MNFLERTFLDWKVMLEPIADRKPPQLKVASVTDAMATPPTIGNRDNTIGMVGVSPKNMADSNTLKNGSRACREVAIHVTDLIMIIGFVFSVHRWHCVLRRLCQHMCKHVQAIGGTSTYMLACRQHALTCHLIAMRLCDTAKTVYFRRLP